MGYTASAKPSELEEIWYVVDAQDKVLGKLACDVASVLRGKHMPNFSPHVDMKTHVIVVNAEKVGLSGRKWDKKIYYHHSGWRGGLRSFTAKELNERKPGELVRRAVKGMLPKNKLAAVLMTHLRIFAGPEHHHQAQKPTAFPEMKAKLQKA